VAVRNSEHNVKWPFKPFKVIQSHVFWGQWKGDKGLNNSNVGLIFLRRRIRSVRNPEKTRFRLPHCCMTPPLNEHRLHCHCDQQRRCSPMTLESRFWSYKVYGDIRGGSLERGGIRNKHVFWTTVRNGPSRSSKVVNFGTNRKHVCHFLFVINSNLGPMLPRFRDIAGFLRRATPPLFHPNFRGVPFWLDWRCCGSEEKRP